MIVCSVRDFLLGRDLLVLCRKTDQHSCELCGSIAHRESRHGVSIILSATDKWAHVHGLTTDMHSFCTTIVVSSMSGVVQRICVKFSILQATVLSDQIGPANQVVSSSKMVSGRFVIPSPDRDHLPLRLSGSLRRLLSSCPSRVERCSAPSVGLFRRPAPVQCHRQQERSISDSCENGRSGNVVCVLVHVTHRARVNVLVCLHTPHLRNLSGCMAHTIESVSRSKVWASALGRIHPVANVGKVRVVSCQHI